MNRSFQYHDGQFVILGRVWSDFAAHIPLIRSFSMGNNFPPEYPTFPGEPIRYHYLFFLLVGLLEKAGINIALALNLVSSLGMFLLLEMIYLYGWKIFGTRRTGVLAVVLFLFNGTFSIWEFIKTSHSIPELINQIITAKEYASFGPWDGHIVSAFWNWNIYINQRHLAMSYGLALLGMFPLLLYSKVNQKKSIFLKLKELLINNYKFQFSIFNFQTKDEYKNETYDQKTTLHTPHSTFLTNLSASSSQSRRFSILGSRFLILLLPLFLIFPLLHQASWIMLCLFSTFWMFTHLRQLPKKLISLYLIAMMLSLIVAITFTPAGSQSIALQFGYLSNPHTIFDFLKYWFFNLGAYLFLIPIILIFAKKQIKLFLIPFLFFFVLANTFRLSPDMINNHKLLNFMMIGFNLAAAAFLVRLTKIHHFTSLLIIPLILILTFSGFVDIFPILNNHYHYIDDYQKNETAAWIKTNTLPKSVFLTNTYLYNPAQLVGRKTFLDYGYFNWSMGYADGQRRQLLSQIFASSGSIAEICQILHEQKVDYILIDQSKADPHPGVILTESLIFKNFSPVFQSIDGWSAYDTRIECLFFQPTVPSKDLHIK